MSVAILVASPAMVVASGSPTLDALLKPEMAISTCRRSDDSVTQLSRYPLARPVPQGRLSDWLPHEGVLPTVFPPNVTDGRALSSLG
jgi:hypothetical protein